jgi:hypothetical protein
LAWRTLIRRWVELPVWAAGKLLVELPVWAAGKLLSTAADALLGSADFDPSEYRRRSTTRLRPPRSPMSGDAQKSLRRKT